MSIALVRHPAVGLTPGLCYGRLDVGLAPDAEAAVAAILARLEGFAPARVVTSPAARCRVVAEAIAAAAGLQAEPDARLQELDFGAWEGRLWDEVPRAALDEWAGDPATFAPPGGESGAALLARVRDFHAGLTGAEPVVVVAHGGPLKLLAALLRGETPDLLAPAPPLGSVLFLPLSPPAR